jgi:hypothetical protein
MRNLEMNINRIRRIAMRPAIPALLLLLAAHAWSAVQGPDAFGYTGTDATIYSFADISGANGGTSVLAGVDDGAVALTLPFNFSFYGTNYTMVCASSNGAVYFVAAASTCNTINDFANIDLTTASPAPDLPAILPFWTDLTFQTPGAGSVFYQAFGTPGNRRFVIQWNNAYPQGDTSSVTFQVVLAEGTNSIAFQYQTVTLGAGDPNSNGALATVGIHNSGGQASGQQLQWSYGAAVLSNSYALQFQTSAVPGQPVLTAPANGATGQSTAVTLMWNAASGATTYDVYLGTAATPPLLMPGVATTSYSATGLIAGTIYYWNVVAKNSSGSSTPSATWSFGGMIVQTITFDALSSVAVGAAPFTVSATASSGLAVTFSSTTPSVCTVSGTTVTILIAGGCSITASQGGSATFAPAAMTQSFTVLFADVAPTDYYYSAISSLAQHSITAGCGNNGYCPQETVTRDDMAIFIVRAVYGSDNFAYSSTPHFTDVPANYFAFKWIQALAALGITAGCGTNLYCPGEVVTRDEMAIFIVRMQLGLYLAGSPPLFTYSTTPYFADVPSGEFAFPWIQRLQEENITGGCSATDYCPSEPVIRGDMAIFIMRGGFNQFLPAGTPVISQISPSTLPLGTSGTFTITGTNTNFVQGTTQLSPIPGVTFGNITVTSPTTLTVQLTAAANAVAQPYSILAITGNEQDVLPNGLVLQ